MATKTINPITGQISVTSMPALKGTINIGNQVKILPGTPAFQTLKYLVQDPSKMVYSKGRIYDILPWGAAGVGAASYNFFARSIQGTVTAEDTNMQQAGNIGVGNYFVITRVSVDFLSGIRPTTTAATDALTTATNRANDAAAVLERGFFNFQVNNLNQILNGIAPLMSLPAPNGIMTNAAVGNVSTTSMQTSSAWSVGQAFDITASPWALQGGVNFGASVAFPAGALTLPSANATSKIGVYLDGWWLRPAG